MNWFKNQSIAKIGFNDAAGTGFDQNLLYHFFRMKNAACCLLFQIVSFISLSAQENKSVAGADSMPFKINLWIKQAPKGGRNVLQWVITDLKISGFCIIQRSKDGIYFDGIGAIKVTGKQNEFEFIDERPVNDKNFYRIKMSGSAEGDMYSPVIIVNNTIALNCKFYPNPVDNVLIVRCELTVELHVYDGVSRIRINQILKPGLQTVDVSILEKGVYIITFYEKETSRMNTEKLIKN